MWPSLLTSHDGWRALDLLLWLRSYMYYTCLSAYALYNVIYSVVVYRQQLGWCGEVPTAAVVSGIRWYLAVAGVLTREHE